MSVDERVLRIGLLLLALGLLVGCLGPPGDTTGNQTPEREMPPDRALVGPWLADPSIGREDGLGPAPVRIFDPTEAPDTEVDVAAHPTRADAIAAAWIAQTEGGWTVWAATTSDGGANWTLQPLHDPSLDGEGHAFDPIVAFGPAGERLFVLYGGERTSSEAAVSRITLAVSQDLGETWDYRYVAEDPLPALGAAYSGWDAMDLAISPDTGNLHVTAQLMAGGSLGGIYAWRSSDAGRTWEGPVPVETPAGQQGLNFWPRISAGEEGLVVVATKGSNSQAVTVSQDDGRTFGAAQPTYAAEGDGMLLGDPLTLTRHESVSRLELAFAAQGLVHLRSDDVGESFSDPATIATPPEGLTHVWSRAVGDEAGGLLVLHTAGSYEAPAWWMGLTKLGADGAAATTTLGTGEAAPPRPEAGAGDEYGGLALAADGSVWAAWSDPRGADTTRIALTRLLPQ